MSAITVIVTTYNFEEIIGSFLGDLFAQTFQDFHVLLLDDCSSDSTIEIVNNYVVNYPGRIQTFYRNENIGDGSKLWNIALDSGFVNGDYVIFLDGDDAIEPKFLEKLYAIAIENHADIAVCAYNRRDLFTGHIICTEMQGFPDMLDVSNNLGTLAFVNTSLWNKLIKREVIGDARCSYENVSLDTYFLLQVYKNCKRIAFTDDVLYNYQVRNNSVINTITVDFVYAFAKDLLQLYDDNKDNSDYAELICLFVFIHIGLSMPMRVMGNKKISQSKHIEWTRTFFNEHFALFRHCSLMKFSSLRKYGFRGYAIGLCIFLYKVRLFQLFLSSYRVFRKISAKDIKW